MLRKASEMPPFSRRTAVAAVGTMAAVLHSPFSAMAAAISAEDFVLAKLPLPDGIEIFFKDWGPKDAQPIMFHHGWPLSADEWNHQMLFFLSHGFRVIAHDRRGHGRSDRTAGGNDMNSYADDVAAIVRALDLHNVVHIGHSAGTGEIARYLTRAESRRVAKAVLIGAVPPIMVRCKANPDGIPREVFDRWREKLATNRAQFFRNMASGPFYGFNRGQTSARQDLIDNWWRQGMRGCLKAHFQCIAAFSETDFTDDLKAFDVPVLFLHGNDDQIAPVAATAEKAIKLVRDAQLKVYSGLSHGMLTTHPEIINRDLLAFVRD